MKTLEIKAVSRADYGKKAAKSIRREGMIPCALYGNGENISFSVEAKEIKPLSKLLCCKHHYRWQD